MSQGLCTSCGAAVNLAVGTTETKCQYCDTIITFQQAEAQFNEVKNSKFGGTLLIAETAQEGGSYAEALNYYNKVIEQQPNFADAWLNKGICMVRTSKIGDLKIPEAISSWKAAIKFAKHPEAMKKRVATEINNVVSAFYPVLEKHYLEFQNLKDSIPDHVNRFICLESALSFALEISPTATICKSGISLCDKVVASIRSTGAMYGGDLKEQVAFALSGMALSRKIIAANLEANLISTKLKYVQALAKIDPAFQALEEEMVKAEQEAEAAKKYANSIKEKLGEPFRKMAEKSRLRSERFKKIKRDWRDRFIEFARKNAFLRPLTPLLDFMKRMFP